MHARPGYRVVVVATVQTEGSSGAEAPGGREPERSPIGDSFVLGEPADLIADFDWSAALRGVTREFFAERDPDRPIGPTVAKLSGAIAAMTGLALALLAALGLVIVVLFRAVFA